MIHQMVSSENLFCTAPDIRTIFATVPADHPLVESMQHINACRYCKHTYMLFNSYLTTHSSHCEMNGFTAMISENDCVSSSEFNSLTAHCKV